MKVLVADPIAEAGIEVLKSSGDLEVDVRTGLSPGELADIIGQYSALVVRSETKVTREIIARADRMEIIARAGVGIDNIDVAAATEKGIIVVNAPEGNTIAAAEHTLAMMLALARNIPQANQLLKAGKWERKRFMGVELRNKVLGIVGLGRIGSEVAKRARGLEMRVLAYDPFISVERAQKMGVEMVGFDQVLRQSDFLTFHLPLTKDTYHLLGREQFLMMKPGVRLVNVARGGIIDEDALYEAIVSGRVAGAAIDVFEHEPMVSSPLFELDNVIVTPHLGASTVEAQVSVAVEVAQDIVRSFRGEVIRNAVNIPSISPELRLIIQPYLLLVEKMGAFLAQLVCGHIESVELKYNGEFARYDLTPLTNAFLKGLLSYVLEEPVNYVNAPIQAQLRGIKVYDSRSPEMEDYTNLVTATVRTDKGEKSVSGALFRRNEPRIVRIDGYTIDAVPEGHMLVIPHIDKPRIIGPVGNLIGAHDVNIAGMQVGRKVIGGRAVMVLNIDAPVPEETLKEMAKIDGVLDVKYVHL